MREDTQRSKVYNAEMAVRAEMNKVSKNAGIDLSTVRLLERYIDGVLKRKRVHDKYKLARHPIQVKDGRGRRSACGGYGEVSFPLWSRTETVVLHEVAHCLAGASVHHNWQFAECHLFLVRQVMGVAAADLLKASYRKHNVAFTPPRPKREVSPEQLARLTERLAANRRYYTRGQFMIRITNANGDWWIRRTSNHFGATATWEAEREKATIWTTREGVERFAAKHVKRDHTIVQLDEPSAPIEVCINPLQLMGDVV